MSRFNDGRDQRYPPPRERSPPRFPDRRPSGSYNNLNFPPRGNDFSRPYSDTRDVPRGPRGVSDTPSRPAPTGPRGGRGGFGGRPDYRESRDSTFPGDRWRDGEDNRWESRRTSPRPRSPLRARSPPLRDRRDSRDYPKPIDTDRARLDSRDGPLSAGSTLSDPPRGTGSNFRGGYSRGRGGEFRDRGGRFPDDRTTFRPRSRSRGPPPRRERDRSVDSRDLDFRERARDSDDRRYFREREDREGFFRRSDVPAKIETRQQPDVRGFAAQSTPQTERVPALQENPVERPGGDPRREHDISRRGSAISATDLGAGRSEAQRAPRAASPPPSVPSFGFRPPPFGGVTSLSWKNPDLSKPLPASGPAQPLKGPPTAPKALAAVPPTAPKADRAVDRSKTPSKESLQPVTDDLRKESQAPARASSSPRVGFGAIPNIQQTVAPTNVQSNHPTPTGNQFLNPPSAPRAMTSPQPPFGRTGPPPGLGRAASPAPTTAIPIGPKSSPGLLPGTIPTGPRADRGPPPTGPRGAAPPKLFKSSSQPFARASIIPSKRDLDGHERERSPPNRPAESLPKDSSVGSYGHGTTHGMENRASASQPHVDQRTVKKEDMSNGVSTDVDMTDVPDANVQSNANAPDEPKAFDNLSDDDDEEFDIAELAEELEAKFVRQKAQLEAKRIDLSLDEYRPSLPLDEMARFIAMRARIPDLTFRARAPAAEKKAMTKDDDSIRESIPAEILTPQEEDQVMAEAYYSRDSSLDRLSTPDGDSLPYLEDGPPTPLSDPDAFSASHVDLPTDDIKLLLAEEHDSEVAEQKKLEDEYRELYINWRKHVMQLDREKEEVEYALRQRSRESTAAPLNSELPLTAALPTPTEGGRRAHRFASEYEYQRVIEMSLREEEEKKQKEREAREAQASATADREAAISRLLTPSEIQRRTFEDVSQARQPEDALRIFELVPPPDDFTEEEDRVMREVFKEYIKAWGKIANRVGRTYKDCINHYYASKWDRPYKTKTGGRKGKGTRGGRKQGAGRQRSALLPAEDAELDSNGAPMVTESGRPRRAAAPTWPKESDQEQTPGASTGKRAGKAESGKEGEPGVEKVGRGRKGGAKESRQKKQSRNPPLAARPTTSPQKVDRDNRDKMVVPMEIEDPWMPVAPNVVRETERMPPLLPQQQLFPDNSNLIPYRESTEIVPASMPTERPRSHSNTTQRQGASSYWSVVEEQDFKKCLEYYGTDFQAIANHMGSKTHTMIKNHYQKFVNDGKHMDLIHKADDATVRRSRGEDMGPPPSATPAQKRQGRYDGPQSSMPRSLAPNNEPAEHEASPPVHPIAPFNVPQFPPRPSGNPQQANRQPAAVAAAPPMHRSHPTGPVMGFFKEDARSMQPQPAPIQPGNVHSEPQPSQPQPAIDRIKTEFVRFERDLQAQRDQMDNFARLQAEKDARAQLEVLEAERERERRDRELLYQRAVGNGPQHAMHGIPSAPEHARSEVRQHHSPYGTPMMGHNNHHNRNMIVELGAQHPAIVHAQMDRRPPSPIRIPTVPPMTQQPMNHPQAPSSAPPAAPREPPKRSNIMSILNSEPEQDRPKRREPEQPPSQSYRIQTTVHTESPTSAAPPRDAFDRPFSRPNYPPHQAPSSVMSAQPADSLARESLPPMAARDSWAGRPTPNFQQTGSPHLQPQHAPPPGPDRGPVFSRDPREYRATAFGALNQPIRANPSPPPTTGAFQHQHARTSSYTHPHKSTPPSSAPGTSNGPPMGMRGINNPYLQNEQHAAGVSPHLSAQHHPPPTTRNDVAFQHNAFPSNRLQDQSREAMFDRFREREPNFAARDREREHEMREREYFMAAQQQRFGHHTPPVNHQRFAPPPLDRSQGATPLGHGGYPPQQPDHPPHAMIDKRHLEYQQELQRRDFEREKSRQERIEAAAREKQAIQAEKAYKDSVAGRHREPPLMRRPDERPYEMPPR